MALLSLFLLPNLHVHQAALLDKLLSTGNTVHLPHEMMFYPRTQKEINDFKDLVTREELHILTHIQYRCDSVYVPAQDAIQTLARLLQQGALPHLRSFLFDYKFPSATKTSSLQTVDGHFLLTSGTTPVALT